MANRAGVVAAAIGVALGLSGCGLLGGSDDATPDGNGGSSSGPVSPVAEYLGLSDLNSGDSDSEAQFMALQTEFGEQVAACMAAEGFEYIPPNLEDLNSFDATTGDGIEYGTPEYTARYGFGVTTQRFAQSAVGPDLVGYDDAPIEDQAAPGDPNDEYVNSLSDAERQAYDAALYGDTPDFAWDESLTDAENQELADAFYADFEPTGCFAEAEANGPFAQATAFYDEFGEELFELYEEIEDDPRFAAQLSEIEACVTEQGLEYVDPSRPYERWEAQLSELEADHFSSGELDSAGRDQLAALQTEEIAIAVATDECGGSQQALSDRFGELVAEYEQRFLDTNAERISQLEAEAEGGS